MHIRQRTKAMMTVLLAIGLTSSAEGQFRPPFSQGGMHREPAEARAQAPQQRNLPLKARERTLPADEPARAIPPTRARGEREKPTGTHLSGQQQGNLTQLKSDLTAIKQGSQVTQQQKDDLKNSLMAMADGATKPDPAAVQKLADDLADAMTDGSLSLAEKHKLAEDAEAVMQSASIPQAEVQQAIADAQAILLASGVDKSDVQTIVHDLQQIATEAKTNAPNSTGTATGGAREKLRNRLR